MVPMMPKMVLRIDWKTAMMEEKMAVMAWKIDETKFPRESTREGILAICVCVLLIWGL